MKFLKFIKVAVEFSPNKLIEVEGPRLNRGSPALSPFANTGPSSPFASSPRTLLSIVKFSHAQPPSVSLYTLRSDEAMAERPFIGASRRGLTAVLSLKELIIFALFVAVCGLALAGPVLTIAEQNPGQHLLSLTTYALLCAVPFAFFLAMLLSFLHAAEAPPSTAPVLALASATFNAAAAAALLLLAVLFLLFFASLDKPSALGHWPQLPPPDGGGFPWFAEEF